MVKKDPWEAFLASGLLGHERLLANADIGVSAVGVGPRRVPLVTNRSGHPDCSWVASLRNAYGRYARTEIRIVGMNRFAAPLFSAASLAAEGMLVAGGLAGGSYLDNWLFATNLYPSDLKADDIQTAVQEVIRGAPDLPVVLRSLTPPLHAPLITKLVQAGFLMLPSRQVWIVPRPANGEWRKRRDSRNDLHLQKSTADRWQWVPSKEFTDDDYADALGLYRRLYRERYPAFNPDFTPHFFRSAVATNLLNVTGLRAMGSRKLSGFLGMIHRDGVACTPFLGYDIDAPPGDGLYRLLTLRAFLECESADQTLHCSAGAGAFKASRGAEPHVEFAAIWANHLPIYKRAGLRALTAAVGKWVVPYLESRRL